MPYYRTKIPFLVLRILLDFNLVSLINGESKVPCYFIFGDSFLDNGNNNLLDTKIKVKFYPYGIDFIQGPTGRFSNGRNIADFIAEFLDFDNFIPPFANASIHDILTGVNYASGAAGILKESGQHLGDRISLERQLQNHNTTILKIHSLIGNKKTEKHLGKCIYTVGIGANDYINNYFLPQFYPETSIKYSPEDYAEMLIGQYYQHLLGLYTYGARKVGVFEIADLGCTPYEIKLHRTNPSCVDMITTGTQIFNTKLYKLVQQFNNHFLDAKFIYIPQIPKRDLLEEGFTVVNKSCCVGNGQCRPNIDPCTDRNAYFSWDGIHPTEQGMKLLASYAIAVLSPFYTETNDNIQHGLDSLSPV